ncbi:MAG: hypothetical protein FJ137_00780 [Deltaproteobacteria bacterium]|nr:hypothetical protein [Deltaproteobacteria bacterium]
MPAAVSAVSAVAFVALAVACALGAAGDASLGESFARVLADPWGRTMVVDLNVGFVAFLVVVWLFEPRRAVAVVLTLLTPVLGNFVPLGWLMARATLLVQRARPGG